MIVDIIQFLLIMLSVVYFYLSIKEKNEKIESLTDDSDTKQLTETQLTAQLRLLQSDNNRLTNKVDDLEKDRDHWRDEAVSLKKDLIRHGAVRG